MKHQPNNNPTQIENAYGASAFRCENCGEHWSYESLGYIHDLAQRIAPEEPVPAGECPDCGALCHVAIREFAFDCKLWATIRVRATTADEAQAKLKEAMDCADANFGAWPDGSPILAEASIEGDGDLYDDEGAVTEFATPVPVPPTDLNGSNPHRCTLTLKDDDDGILIQTSGDEAKDWAVAVTGEMADPIVDEAGLDIILATARLKGWRIIDARVPA